MVDFSEAVKQQSRVVLCNLLGGPDSVPYLGAPVGGPLLPSALEEQVQRARKWVCNDPNPIVDFPSPEVEGGQCPGVEYRAGAPNVTSPSVSRGIGPLSVSTERIEDFDGTGRPVFRIIFSWAGGLTGGVGSTQSFDDGPSPTISERYMGVLATRVDDQPDICGDSPVTIPPYVEVTVTNNLTWIDNLDVEITEEGDFTVLAPVFIGGAIIAPITVNVGGVKFPVEVNLSTGDITLDFGGDDSPPEIIDENPEDNPTDDAPEQESSDLLYGLIVYSTQNGPGRVASTLVGQAGAPELYLPRTGNVWFQVPAGERVSWVGPIAVQAENQIVMVPHGLGASGYRLVPASGWQLEAVRLGKPSCGCISS